MKKRCFKGGFTLIELLVVVLIIGVLAAIALPMYNKAVEKSHVAEALTMLNSLEKAMDMWILDHGFPTGRRGPEFLGKNTKQNELILDLSSLNCNSKDVKLEGQSGWATWNSCSSDNWDYSAFLYDKGIIYIQAARHKKADLSDVQSHYFLDIGILSNGEKTYECEYIDDLGESVCKSLENQGWTTSAL